MNDLTTTDEISTYNQAAITFAAKVHELRTGRDRTSLMSCRPTFPSVLITRSHTRPEYTCRFAWQEGSIAFWDNRAVQHYAAGDYFPHQRVLRRITVSGDRPFYDPERACSAPVP